MNILLQKGKERNIILYYLLTISTNLWFGASNWLYVWRRFMSFGQLGWVDGIGFGFSLILDIPTGAFADLVGKRIALIISNILAGIGITFIAFANDLPTIFIGNIITQIGWAMYSGASDAVVYDSLLDLKKEHLFTHISSKANQYMSYAAAFGYFTGGILYELHWRLPHIAWALSYIPAILFSIMLIEPNRVQERISVKKYLEKISLGIRELWLPQIRRYLVLIFVLLGFYFLYTWGFVRPAIATSFGFYSKEQAIILPIITLSIAYLIRFIPWLKNHISDFSGLTMLGIILAIGFIASAFPIGYWGIIPMFFIAFAGKFASPWIAIIVNKEISSKYRATTLSTISLLSKVPYVAVAILIGQAAEKNMLSEFCLGTGGIILISIFFSTILYHFSKKNLN